MGAPIQESGQRLDAPHAFDIHGPKARLCATEAGGFEIVHESTLLQIGVYTLVAPEPDHQRVNTADELYIVLEGYGLLDVEGEPLELREGHAVFVPARADHRFRAYEHLSVLAIVAGRTEDDSETSTEGRSSTGKLGRAPGVRA
jgi:mannose-6-phosphate isomerase-like protein (cupin superfamily)